MKTLLGVACFMLSAALLTAQEKKPDKYRAMIDKGLAWLVKQQADDGSWPGDKNGMAAVMTAFAGMALLADGNTLAEGKYAPNLRRSLAWFLRQKPADAKYDGVLGLDPESPETSSRYMMDHGIALSFLAHLHGEAEGEDRAALRKRLQSAVAFSVKGQTPFGGWYYTSTIEWHNQTENVSTMLQLQGLIDARNAGIAVPKKTLEQAHRYLQSSTTERGGVAYSRGQFDGTKFLLVGGGRPAITAMALAAFVPVDSLRDETTRRWLLFCAEQPDRFALDRLATARDDLLAHYHFSKVVFHLTADEWRAAFPDKKMPDHLQWQKYRVAMFDYLNREQGKEGSWELKQRWTLGPGYNTSLALNILLYENTIPIRLSR